MADDLTLGELGRQIAALAGQVSGLADAITRLRGELVAREVYDADRRADAERDRRMQSDIDRLQREADDRDRQHQADKVEQERQAARGRAETKRLVWGAVLGCVGAVIATVVAAWMLR